MSKVVVFAGCTFETACCAVDMARALARAGYEPTLVGDGRWLESSVLVGRAELPFRHSDPQPIPELLDGRGNVRRADIALAGAVAADLDALHALEADLVVSVSWPPGLAAAAMCFVPSVSIVEIGRFPQCFSLRDLDKEYDDILETAWRPLAAEDLAAVAADGEAGAAEMASLRRPVPRGIREFFATQGLAAPRWIDDLYRGDHHTLLASIGPPKASVPDATSIAGAFPADIASAEPGLSEIRRHQRPLAYVELEPTNEALIAQVCRDLSRASIDSIAVSRGELVEARGARVFRHIPHELATRAASLVVCEGQSALVAAALAAETPIIALPASLHAAVECVDLSRNRTLSVLPRADVELGASPVAPTAMNQLARGSARPDESAPDLAETLIAVL